MDAFAQVIVGDLVHPRVNIVIDALHRRFRGQAGVYRIADAPEPADVLGDHPVGFEDVTRWSGVGKTARSQHVIDCAVHVGDGAAQPLVLEADVLGDHPPDQETVLVHHRQTHTEPGVDPRAFKTHRDEGDALRR